MSLVIQHQSGGYVIPMAIKKCFPLITILLVTSLTCCTGNKPGGSGQEKPDYPEDTRELSMEDYSLYNLCGEDVLGRTIERVDSQKKEKYVGIFYSMWLGQHKSQQTGVYNVTYLESSEEGLAYLNSVEDSEYSRMNEFHFWGEPLYGYYNTSDPWVLSRHMELFMNAGIDYLCIDATNRVVYNTSITTLLDLLNGWSKEGKNIPKVMFYTNSYSGDTVRDLYYKFYQTDKYNDVWFAPNGKPLIIGITKNNNRASDQTKFNPGWDNFIDDEMIAFFDVKESEWPNGDHNDNSIPWMSWDYPQRVHNGSIAVPVAQHSHSRISVSYKDPECSRGYNNKTGHIDGDPDSGLSFQQMWETALNDNYGVTNALVCSFNEWMAIKQFATSTTWHMVDVCDYEYSRDIEMMKGGYNDNYYLQLVENVRQFKYEPFVKYKKTPYNIDIHNGVSPIWNYVKTYADLTHDAINRNFDGAVNGLHYEDNSARNDISLAKVAHSNTNLYFYIECLEDITTRESSDEGFMNIFIKTKETTNNFIGFNYVINRHEQNGKASIEKCNGGYNFTHVGDADISISGNVMQLSVPRSLIETSEECDIEFKITDNITHPEDVMDYYISGDAMPIGRLHYGY